MTIFIAVLNQGDIRQELVQVLSYLTHNNKHTITLSYPAEKPISYNRNKIVKDFLESGHDYLLMIDGDNVPPINILDMVEHEKEIVGGLCFAYMKDAIIPLVLKKNENGSYTTMRIDGSEGLIECDAVGSGCMMIKREVLEEIKAPFLNEYDEDGIKVTGLDIAFCRRAKEKGFKVWCDLNQPISHITMIDLKKIYNILNLVGRAK